MSKSYNVTVDNTHKFSIDSNELSEADIMATGSAKHHVLYQDVSLETEIITADFNNKLYKVKVNNKIYNVNIYSDLDNLIKSLGFEIGISKMVNEIKAPMPGLLLDIHVEPGQTVNEDDPLLILEAMKMENVITSPRSGTIKSVKAAKGDAVEKSQLLIEFES